MTDQTAAGFATNDHFNTDNYDYVELDEEEAKDVSAQNQGLGNWLARGVSSVMGHIRPATEEPISPERTPSRGSIELKATTTKPQATASRQKTGKANKPSGPSSTKVASEVAAY